jgi:cytoplasmic tRNA 2-thiolation protein 1
MKLLNDRYSYGLDLVLLSIDEGITGYRDDSLETVKRNRDQYQIPLLIVSYKDLYGWSMDDIVKEIGRKNNCKGLALILKDRPCRFPSFPTLLESQS